MFHIVPLLSTIFRVVVYRNHSLFFWNGRSVGGGGEVRNMISPLNKKKIHYKSGIRTILKIVHKTFHGPSEKAQELL